MMLSLFTMAVVVVVLSYLWVAYGRDYRRLTRLPIAAPLAGPAATARVQPRDRR